MRPADVPAAEQMSDSAFFEVDQRTLPPSAPPAKRRSPERSAAWARRTARFLETDPDGCWVADEEGEVVGFATSLRRERLWVLATFVVEPGRQGKGVGRELLAAAQTYAEGAEVGMLAASEDPLALRRYHAAGFSLWPQLFFHGEVDRSAIPAVSGVRDGAEADREWMDELDRSLRGGPHGSDHTNLADMAALVVAADRSGYAYASKGATYLVAARGPETATALLWECLARGEANFEISHVTTANPWAVDVAMQARLRMSTRGHLAVRGMAPPAPYIHNGAML